MLYSGSFQVFGNNRTSLGCFSGFGEFEWRVEEDADYHFGLSHRQPRSEKASFVVSSEFSSLHEKDNLRGRGDVVVALKRSDKEIYQGIL